MNNPLRIASALGLVAVLGLSACVWDRGEQRRERGPNMGRDRGDLQQRDGHDRDGRACDGQARDARHDEDCRPRRP
jgi:hypothetical protein